MNVLELTVVHLLRAVRLRGGPGRAAAVTPPLCMVIGDDLHDKGRTRRVQ